ncbi:hypothetical protein [Dyella terrae]|uniref:hypothetical protein n=1 Tax=Dyella terrae TaxID=522259 RepID=UPI001EFC455A|nr:hypothetical protein [Dyella terrae]ULU23894.1 hypothetical protein DYST_00792 [Dyella terrae]
MTQRPFAIALCVLLISSALPHEAQAASYKKTYCGDAEFVTNDGASDDGGSIYPHLHCDSRWITFSKSDNNQKNFLNGTTFLKEQAIQACQDEAVQLPIKQAINKICSDNGQDCAAACT